MGSHNNFIGRSGLQNICVVVPVLSKVDQGFIKII